MRAQSVNRTVYVRVAAVHGTSFDPGALVSEIRDALQSNSDKPVLKATLGQSGWVVDSDRTRVGVLMSTKDGKTNSSTMILSVSDLGKGAKPCAILANRRRFLAGLVVALRDVVPTTVESYATAPGIMNRSLAKDLLAQPAPQQDSGEANQSQAPTNTQQPPAAPKPSTPVLPRRVVLDKPSHTPRPPRLMRIGSVPRAQAKSVFPAAQGLRIYSDGKKLHAVPAKRRGRESRIDLATLSAHPAAPARQRPSWGKMIVQAAVMAVTTATMLQLASHGNLAVFEGATAALQHHLPTNLATTLTG